MSVLLVCGLGCMVGLAFWMRAIHLEQLTLIRESRDTCASLELAVSQLGLALESVESRVALLESARKTSAAAQELHPSVGMSSVPDESPGDADRATSDWVAALASEGAPFLAKESLPPETLSTFSTGQPHVYLESYDGSWLGEFRLANRDGASLELLPDEVPTAREIALAYCEIQDLKALEVKSALARSTDVFTTAEEAQSFVAAKRAANPDGPGWYWQQSPRGFVVCERSEPERIVEIKTRITTLVEQLGGDTRIGGHGVSWTKVD